MFFEKIVWKKINDTLTANYENTTEGSIAIGYLQSSHFKEQKIDIIKVTRTKIQREIGELGDTDAYVLVKDGLLECQESLDNLRESHKMPKASADGLIAAMLKLADYAESKIQGFRYPGPLDESEDKNKDNPGYIIFSHMLEYLLYKKTTEFISKEPKSIKDKFTEVAVSILTYPFAPSDTVTESKVNVAEKLVRDLNDIRERVSLREDYFKECLKSLKGAISTEREIREKNKIPPGKLTNHLANAYTQIKLMTDYDYLERKRKMDEKRRFNEAELNTAKLKHGAGVDTTGSNDLMSEAGSAAYSAKGYVGEKYFDGMPDGVHLVESCSTDEALMLAADKETIGKDYVDDEDDELEGKPLAEGIEGKVEDKRNYSLWSGKDIGAATALLFTKKELKLDPKEEYTETKTPNTTPINTPPKLSYTKALTKHEPQSSKADEDIDGGTLYENDAGGIVSGEMMVDVGLRKRKNITGRM